MAVSTSLSPDAAVIASEFKEFTSIVSHDFRAPLRAVVEFSRLLNDEHAEKLDEEGKLYLSLIRKSGEKLNAMLDGLLEYSRLSTMGGERVQSDTGDLVQQAITAMKDKMGASHAEIKTEGEFPSLTLNPKQFQRAMFVLLDNAVKFSAAGRSSHIVIASSRCEGGWQFSVQDNGIGIEQDFHERIFMPFRKLHTDEEYPGVGMGLTIAKKTAELHDGTIALSSRPGVGSSFKVIFPDR